MKLDRANFQRLAEARIEDAKALLDNQRWEGAYYLAGYAVEYALKSCILGNLLAAGEFPDKRFVADCYTHDLAKLLLLAGLRDKLGSDPKLEDNWLLVTSWNEQVRYKLWDDVGNPGKKAEEFLLAVTDPAHGVLPWIQASSP